MNRRQAFVTMGVAAIIAFMVFAISSKVRENEVDSDSAERMLAPHVELGGPSEKKAKTESLTYTNNLPSSAVPTVTEYPNETVMIREHRVQFLEERVRQLENSGRTTPQQLFRKKEQLRLARSDQKTETLQDWLITYNGHLYSPPPEIDITDGAEYHFHSPEETVAAYWKAMFRGDVEALFSMCDEQAQQLLRNHFNLEPGSKMQFEFDGATEMSLLMRGELQSGGEQFVLLYIRRVARDPLDGILSLQSMIVRRSGERYLITEMPRLSAFADVSSIAGIDFYPYGPYTNLLPKLTASRLPKSFYTVAEDGDQKTEDGRLRNETTR